MLQLQFGSRHIHPRTLLLALLILLGFGAQGKMAYAEDRQQIIVAGGCFWCVEKDFEQVKGVIEAESGYIGGTVANPSYKQVTKGGTGHYEAVRITYDADVITARSLYDMFFRSVDPTDAGGQFCDRGASYRTAIFADGADRKAAEAAKADAQAALGQTIVTPIEPTARFYVAEDYHQDYYKSSKIVLTRFGPLSRANAYKRYRKACGRDARVQELWGSAAPFVN